MIRLIIVLVFAVIVAIFALQNTETFAIKFLFWTFPQLSEALVIIGSVLFGVVLGAILVWRDRLRRLAQQEAPASPPRRAAAAPEESKPSEPEPAAENHAVPPESPPGDLKSDS